MPKAVLCGEQEGSSSSSTGFWQRHTAAFQQEQAVGVPRLMQTRVD